MFNYRSKLNAMRGVMSKALTTWYVFDDPDCNVWKCGNCGEPYQFEEGNPLDNKYFFCPNCGYPKVEFETLEWVEEDET